MKRNKQHICLFSCCIPVLGATRSLICDVQRNILQPIPNSLFSLIQEFKTLDIDNLLLFYGELNKTRVKEYIDFLIEKEFAFFCREEDLVNFPKLNLDYKFAGSISTAIYEIADIYSSPIKTVLRELESVQCYSVEVRISCLLSIKEFRKFLLEFKNRTIKDITILLYYNDFCNEELKAAFLANSRLTKLIVCCSPSNEYLTHFHAGDNTVLFTTADLMHFSCCGNFSFDHFENNIEFISEAQKHNTCLNRKISIDSNGNIKNCPATQQVFGNICQVKLSDVIKDTSFNRVWNINKDDIETCKDCEFRYVCLDCRAFIEDPMDPYSKPLKCGYDPYTTTWSEWSQNPLKQAAISHYKFAKINNP